MKICNPLVAISIAAALASFANWACAEIATTSTPSASLCPTQAVPAMPRAAIRGFAQEEVKVRALVRDGAIYHVEIVKGARVYGPAIREAMEKYGCRQQASDYWVTQEFHFDSASE